MIASLRHAASTRLAWGLLSLSALLFELCGLFFQHVMGLPPCVMCIYERVAFLGIALAGLLGMLQPRLWPLRWAALLLWGYSSLQGLQLSLQHVDYQMNPSPFNTCSLFAEFPTWLPLDRWLPWLFNPTGDCAEIQWQFLGWSMPQWLVLIFGAYLAVFLIIALANLTKGRCCQ